MDKCRHCGTELPPTHTGPCPKCGGKSRVLDLAVSDGVVVHESIGIRQKRKGFGKFMIESIQGWFQSINPKLNKGVHKERIIDKERNEYHETVKDATTGKIIRDIHEPLSQHKSSQKLRGLKEGVQQMGTKGRKNIKKAKKKKEKKK